MKILLVEDDSFFQKFYSAKLKEQGFEVDVASNGQECLQKLQTSIPNVIILDMIMPVMNGFELLQKMSQDSKLKQIPVLVFSTLGQEKDVEEAKKLGAKDYISKSFFDFEGLKQKILTTAAQPAQ